MRIEGNSRLAGTGYGAGSVRGNAADAFALGGQAAPGRATNTVPSTAAGGIEALLALQAADEPLLARKKAVRRGRTLLDTLDEMKADLLLGRASEGRLNLLTATIGQAREKTLPGLDAAIDEIELRVAVELAKFGRFAGA